jgi:hypothetical protein
MGKAASVTTEELGTMARPEGNQNGMHIFQDKPSDQDGLVDIIAVHGLGGHPEKTWTWTSSKSNIGESHNWLQEFLPKQVPTARIMSFGYNSTIALSRSVGRITTFADQLLQHLLSNRQSEQEKRRPIIFVCHSLGGLVVKEVCQSYIISYTLAHGSDWESLHCYCLVF